MLVLNFADKPAAIVRKMDETRLQDHEAFVIFRRRHRLFSYLILAGTIFVIIDIANARGLFFFTFVGIACWLVALAGWFSIRRGLAYREPPGKTDEKQSRAGFYVILFITILAIVCCASLFDEYGTWNATIFVSLIALIIVFVRQKGRLQTSDFGPKYELARTLFATIQDDITPKGACTGWLDLTGTQQPSKRIKERSSRSGMPVGYFRDEWLRLKAPLLDGSLLRLSAVERTKARLGRWKKNARGKQKWKAGGVVQDREFLRLVVIPNPKTQQLAGDLPVVSQKSAPKIGLYFIQTLTNNNGRLVCEAVSNDPASAQDMLQLMKYAHGFVRSNQAVPDNNIPTQPINPSGS